MSEAINFFVDMWSGIIAVLDNHSFAFGEMQVSLSALFFAFLVTSIVISVFWRGARG